MLHKIFFVMLATLVGCQKQSDSGSAAMDKFMGVPTATNNGGLALANGEYAKYLVTSDQSQFRVQVEISSQGHCYSAQAELPVASLGLPVGTGQALRYPNMLLQIKAQAVSGLPHNSKFVHVVLDRVGEAEVPCSGAPRDSISETEFTKRTQAHFFASYGLTDRQLAMASAELLHGAKNVMLYIRNFDLGLAVDATSGHVVGIDIPKQRLESDYVFTSARGDLLTQDVPESEQIPLMMSEEDVKIYRRTKDMVRQMRLAVGATNVTSTWAALFPEQVR